MAGGGNKREMNGLSLCTWESSGFAQVDGIKVIVATFSRLGKGGTVICPPVRQPSAEGVKASQRVWLLMIAAHRDLASVKGKALPRS